MNKNEFRRLVRRQGKKLYRDMPWRMDTHPYFILVSELMLQQTQVDRVIPKFNAFINRFPDLASLATAPLADVLTFWSGLGYNRRAKYLHAAAQVIVNDFGGVIPSTQAELVKLPGIGPSTAAALLAYGFNQPVVFVETNIRTVYFYHFFEAAVKVSDTELLDVVRATADTVRPRQWYWALMDYGSYLKRQGKGQISRSAHYKKQAPLQGSVREMRGQIVRLLVGGALTEQALYTACAMDSRFSVALQGLINDGLVMRDDSKLYLTK